MSLSLFAHDDDALIKQIIYVATGHNQSQKKTVFICWCRNTNEFNTRSFYSLQCVISNENESLHSSNSMHLAENGDNFVIFIQWNALKQIVILFSTLIICEITCCKSESMEFSSMTHSSRIVDTCINGNNNKKCSMCAVFFCVLFVFSFLDCTCNLLSTNYMFYFWRRMQYSFLQYIATPTVGLH